MFIAFIISLFFLTSRCSRAVSCLSAASISWSNDVNSRQSNLSWRSTGSPSTNLWRMNCSIVSWFFLSTRAGYPLLSNFCTLHAKALTDYPAFLLQLLYDVWYLYSMFFPINLSLRARLSVL
jgi:hypothetical protein